MGQKLNARIKASNTVAVFFKCFISVSVQGGNAYTTKPPKGLIFGSFLAKVLQHKPLFQFVTAFSVSQDRPATHTATNTIGAIGVHRRFSTDASSQAFAIGVRRHHDEALVLCNCNQVNNWAKGVSPLVISAVLTINPNPSKLAICEWQKFVSSAIRVI